MLRCGVLDKGTGKYMIRTSAGELNELQFGNMRCTRNLAGKRPVDNVRGSPLFVCWFSLIEVGDRFETSQKPVSCCCR